MNAIVADPSVWSVTSWCGFMCFCGCGQKCACGWAPFDPEDKRAHAKHVARVGEPYAGDGAHPHPQRVPCPDCNLALGHRGSCRP